MKASLAKLILASICFIPVVGSGQSAALTIEITNIRFEKGWISLLDDVNGNDQMDYKLIKIPGEGFGFSNNVKPRLKHPPYDHCSFLIPEGPSRIRIEMQYFRKKT